MTLRKRNKGSANGKTRSTTVQKRIRSVSRSLGVNQSTIYAALVLLGAIGTAVLWNAFDTVDPGVRKFLQLICQESYCNDVLRPTRRTQKTTRDVPMGQRLVEIPRRFLLWDLDALRNDFIQRELFPARIFGKQPLEADVFLSAYIALLRHNSTTTTVSPVLQKYLQVLPTFDDFAEYHPLLMDKNITKILSKESYTFHLIQYTSKMIQVEYEALTNASTAFAAVCDWTDFVSARLAVMTRSFGTGKLHENERIEDGRFDSLKQEMDFYHEKAGVDLSSGSFAMVPILDLYNHHAQPNVGYSYDPIRRAFVIRSLGLTAGFELWDSYGKHSDPHLYSKYGFINGDGSESTQASLAVWHTLLTLSNETKDHELLRYLAFDDGYEKCIDPKHGGPSWDLKLLKYQHLKAMAHNTRFWTVIAGPRNPNARPGASSETSSQWPPRNKPLRMESRVDPDIKGVVGLCRLLVTTHEDFDGRAIHFLQENLEQAGNYVLPQASPNSALEFRTLKCLDRLASQSIARFDRTIFDAERRIDTMSVTSSPSVRTEWTAAHLELGELQTLDLIRGMAKATLMSEWSSEEELSGEAFNFRLKPCPPGFLYPLADAIV